MAKKAEKEKKENIKEKKEDIKVELVSKKSKTKTVKCGISDCIETALDEGLNNKPLFGTMAKLFNFYGLSS